MYKNIKIQEYKYRNTRIQEYKNIRNFSRIFLYFYIPVFLFAIAAPALAAGSLDIGLEYGELTGLGTKDIRETVASIINVALSLLGIIAVVIILAGGFTWMTAAGNEDRLEKAKKMIFAGIIGLAIILSAYAIARFVLGSLIEAAR